MLDEVKLVERVARALCALNFKRKGAEGEFGTVDDCWFAFTDQARAAIEATRPTAATDDVVKELVEATMLPDPNLDLSMNNLLLSQENRRLREALALVCEKKGQLRKPDWKTIFAALGKHSSRNGQQVSGEPT